MPTGLRELRTLDSLAAEAANRPIRRRELEVVDYQPADPRPETHLALEGTVTLLAARSGSRLMAEIREALATKPSKTEDVAKKLYLQYKKRKQVPLARGVKTAIAQPVFAHVLHGNLVLLENLFVPKDLEVAFVPFPYNGGALAETGLVLVEHPVSEDAEPLDVLVLRHTPELSKAERAALEKVPAEQRALNLGRGPGIQACSVALLVVAVVVEVAVVAVTFAITGSIDLRHMDHIDPAEIKKMGPAKTARALVEKRRQFLQTKQTQKQKRV
jgi:hypothetical protein